MCEKIEITYQNKKYMVNKFLVDSLKKIDVNVNDDYINYLIQNRNPYFFINDLIISELLRFDLWNRRLYNNETGLGNLLVYDKKGKIIGEYSSLVELMVNVNQSGLIYGFRKLHDNGDIPIKKKIDFYGVQITYCEQHPCLRTLNDLVKEINSWRNGKRPENIYNDQCYINAKKQYSFEDFVKQRVKYSSFQLGLLEYNTIKKMNKGKDNPGVTEQDYRKQIDNLFKRYTVENKCGFEEVVNLNIIDKYTGIYVLCFDLEKKYYIGKASKSFKDRIIQHFLKPSSNFDDTHNPTDVSKIYVMHTSNEFIDFIEQDCISTIDNNYLLNSLAGGHSIDFIHDENYDPNKYKLSIEFIKMIVEDIDKVKSINKYNIMVYEFMRNGEKMVKKIKTLKPDNITKELCEEVIMFDGNIISYIPLKFKTPELCLNALSYGGDLENVYNCIPKEYLTEDYIMKLISINRRITKFLPKELKTNKVMEFAGYRRKQKNTK